MHDAILHACRMRLRPILMTSIAFCAGVVPLIIGSGAGSEMRRAMGIAVFSRHGRRDLVRHLPDAGVLRAAARRGARRKAEAAARLGAARAEGAELRQ